MQEKIRQAIKSAVRKLYPEHKDIDFNVDYAPENTGADLASNVALVLGKKLGRKPMEVAKRLREAIPDSIGALGLDFRLRGNDIQIEIAPPGFLNFTISDEYLENNLLDIVREGDDYGSSEKKNKQKVLVEYFQPNIVKSLHVGHMRSAIIGDCLYRVNKLFARKVESDTHMGDWGTQFGILLCAYKKWGDEKIVSKDPITELNKLYVRINNEIEKNPKLREEGKAEFVRLEQGDKENRKLWKKFVDWSMERFLQINDLLDVMPFDHHWPESFYEDKMSAVVERLKKEKLLKPSEGAQIVDLTSYNLGTAMIVKSDGGTTYLLRDLSTYLYRKNEGFDRQLYVVDNRQAHAFKQLFKIMELLGEWKEGDAEHISFGFMSLPEGTLSTRKGNIIELEEVVAKAKEKAQKIMAQKNPGLVGAGAVSRDVAIGALKYFDLSHNRNTDLVFSWEKALDFEGNSGPYIQYTHARIQSILRKAKESTRIKNSVYDNPEEKKLLRLLVRFPETVQVVFETSLPNHLADYLFELCSAFNNYYQKIRILQEEDADRRLSRLMLASGVAQVIRNGLWLLGITAPEEM